MELKRILEAVLFVSSKPVTLKRLSERLEGYMEADILMALFELRNEYNGSDRAIEIVEAGRGYQMRTKVDYKESVKRFVKEKDMALTRAVLETLSIVAYKQPVTKKEVDFLRGVDSARTLKQLLEFGFIKIGRRTDDMGKPMTFGTTNRFLEIYGLKCVEDLPTLKEIESLEG